MLDRLRRSSGSLAGIAVRRRVRLRGLAAAVAFDPYVTHDFLMDVMKVGDSQRIELRCQKT